MNPISLGIPVVATTGGEVNGPGGSNVSHADSYAGPIPQGAPHPGESPAAEQYHAQMMAAVEDFLAQNQGYSTYITQLSTDALAISGHMSAERISSAAAQLAKGLQQFAPW